MGKKRRVKGYKEDEVPFDTSIFDDPEAYQKYLEELDSEGELKTSGKTQSSEESKDDNYEDESGAPVTEETLHNIMKRMVSGSNDKKSDMRESVQKAEKKVEERRQDKEAGRDSQTTKKEFNREYGNSQKKDNVVCQAVVGSRRIQVNGRKECILSIDPMGRSSVIPFFQEESVSVDNEVLANIISSFIEGCEFSGFPDVVFLLDGEGDDLETIQNLLRDENGVISGRKVLSNGTQLHILESRTYPNLAFGYILEPLEWTQRVGQALLDVINGRASIPTTLTNGFAFLLDTNVLMMGQRIAVYDQLIHYGVNNQRAVDRFVQLWNSEESTEDNILATKQTYESMISSIYEFFSELIAVDGMVNAEEEESEYEEDDRDLGGFNPYNEYEDPSAAERTGGSTENRSFREGAGDASADGVREESGGAVREQENLISGNREVNGDLRKGTSHSAQQRYEEKETEAERERNEKFRSGEITAADLLSKALDEVLEEGKKEQAEAEGIPGYDREAGKEAKAAEEKVEKSNAKPMSGDDKLLIDPII